MDIEKNTTLDLLDTSGAPALSSTSDMPVVETKPDATNEGAPPAAPETKADEAKVEDKTESESATDPEAEPSANDEPKKAKGVQKRLDELVKEREQERAEKLRLLALVEQLQQKKPEPEPEPVVADDEPIRPIREAYDDPAAWEAAMLAYTDERADWASRKAIEDAKAEAKAAAEQRAIEEGQRAANERFVQAEVKAREKHADFEQVAYRADVEVPMMAVDAIRQSEAGPELLYYLGQNPAEAKQLFTLNPFQMIMRLGQIEAKLTAAPAPAPVISAAPKPVTPIAPASETITVDAENESVEAYAARRRREMGYADPQGRRTRH